MNKMTKELSKVNKLKSLGLNEDEKGITNKLLDQIYDNIVYNKKYEQKIFITRKQKLYALGLNEDTSVTELSDDILNKIYKKVIDEICSKKSDISRRKKLEKLNLDINTPEEQLSDIILDQLYKEKISPSEKTVAIKKAVNKVLDKNDPKYILTLLFLNKILEKLGKDNIDQLTDFKAIKKDDLLKEECVNVLNEYLDKIAKTFGRQSIQYNKRTQISSYIITVIKSMVSICGYNIKSYKCQRQKKQKDGTIKHDYWLEYTIYS